MSGIHQHTYHDHEHGETSSGLQLGGSILLNFIITVAEIAGGLISGSLALLSDALHNFSDTASLVISLAAIRISARQPDQRRTYGYRRAQIIGALINLVTLVLIAIYLIREAIERYFNPQPIEGRTMLVVSTIGLAANLFTAALLYKQSRHSLNIRSAFLHIVGDSVSSVGVVLGAVLITRFQVYAIDAILTAGISIYILVHSFSLLSQTINILMQSVPDGLDLEKVITAIKSFEGVLDVHHVHIWQLDENHTALEAHIVIRPMDAAGMTDLKKSIKDNLGSLHHIHHTTLEFEFQACDCSINPGCYEPVK